MSSLYSKDRAVAAAGLGQYRARPFCSVVLLPVMPLDVKMILCPDTKMLTTVTLFQIREQAAPARGPLL